VAAIYRFTDPVPFLEGRLASSAWLVYGGWAAVGLGLVLASPFLCDKFCYRCDAWCASMVRE
jgi:hypothetical protein